MSKWKPQILNNDDRTVAYSFQDNDWLEKFLRQEQINYDKITDEHNKELGWRMLSIADELDTLLMKLAKAKDDESQELVSNINHLIITFCNELDREKAVEVLELVYNQNWIDVAFLLAQHYINYIINLP